jgi:uncharacterized protein (DUF2141 family)
MDPAAGAVGLVRPRHMGGNEMKSRISVGLAITMLSLASIAAAADIPDARSDVRVLVSTLRNSSGHVICSLFDSEDAYSKLTPAQKVSATPVVPETTCVFHNVRPGTYMVSAIHDENDNDKLDKNFFGMPKEGYGVSNNHTYAMHGPSFSESTFTVSGGDAAILSIQLRYPGGGGNP